MKITAKLQNRDKKLLYIFLSVVILTCSYQFGYLKLSSKARRLDEKNIMLQSAIDELKIKEVEISKYEADILNNSQMIHQLLEEFPSQVTKENSILFVRNLEVYSGIHVSSISFENLSPLSSTQLEDGQVIRLYVGSIGITYEGNYNGLKKAIDYINKHKEKKNISNVTATYDSITELVTGTITIKVYALDGGEWLYKEPNYSGKVGKDNIFDTGKLRK